MAALCRTLAEKRDPDLRAAAAVALERLGDPAAVPALIAATRRSSGEGNVSDQVVEAATEALIAQDPDLMETVLLELFDGGSPVDLSKAALGLERLGSEAARSRLIAALREPDRDVRMTAAQAWATPATTPRCWNP